MTTQAPRNDVGPDNTIVWEPAQPAEERPAGKRLIWLLIAAVVGGLLVIVGILYVAGYLVTGDKVPRKAQISGVAVGGLSRSEAIQKLSVELGARAAEPMNLTVGEKDAQLKPAEAGLAVDYAQSVDAAGGGKSLNPRAHPQDANRWISHRCRGRGRPGQTPGSGRRARQNLQP